MLADNVAGQLLNNRIKEYFTVTYLLTFVRDILLAILCRLSGHYDNVGQQCGGTAVERIELKCFHSYLFIIISLQYFISYSLSAVGSLWQCRPTA